MKKRLENILILVVAMIYSLWRGNANKENRCLENFVVIYPTNNIGDMVCVTPVFRAIKKKYPHSHVSVIGSLKNRELLMDNVDIDEYIDVNQSLHALVRLIRKRMFDAGIVINLDTVNLATLFFGNVSSISCFRLTKEFAHFESRPYKFISSLAYQTEYFPGEYIPRQNLNLLKPFNIVDIDDSKHLGCSHEGKVAIAMELQRNNILENEKIVALAPGAGSPLKQWPAKRFAEVGNCLYREHGISLVIIGSPSDQSAIEEVIKNFNPEVRYWNPGPQTMDALKATIARATLVVGNDSGSIHVGEAVGVMTLTIAGTTDVDEHMREDDRHKIVRSPLKFEGVYRSCIGNEEKIDFTQAQKQMNSITIDDVTSKINLLLVGIRTISNI